MKKAFARIPQEKKEKIILACIEEFGKTGFEKSSTDRIIKRAGISKGGLYEYISSKKELFLYVVEYSYTELYNYLRMKIQTGGISLPPDILERFRLVSSLAIDFYLAHPHFISLITKTYQLSDQELANQVQDCFSKQFLDIFGDVHIKNLNYPKEKILDLLSWLLLKTRQDFLMEMERNSNLQTIQENYLKNWDFYISVLGAGIYSN